jgi:hypothetical protein
MMLYEEGKFQLNDPVANYLPEFAKMHVGVEEKDPQTGQPVLKTVPAKRPITIRDLLRHGSCSCGFFGNTSFDQKYREAGILSPTATSPTSAKLSRLRSRTNRGRGGTTASSTCWPPGQGPPACRSTSSSRRVFQPLKMTLPAGCRRRSLACAAHRQARGRRGVARACDSSEIVVAADASRSFIAAGPVQRRWRPGVDASTTCALHDMPRR